MQHYGPWEAIEIISLIRRFDAASKGNGSRLAPFDLLLDLTLHILHPLGQKRSEKSDNKIELKKPIPNTR